MSDAAARSDAANDAQLEWGLAADTSALRTQGRRLIHSPSHTSPKAPFRRLWTKSVLVCAVFGGSTGTLALFAPWGVKDAVRQGHYLPWHLLVGGIELFYTVIYGAALALPVSILGGTLAAGLLWWFRDHWTFRRHATWILVGTLLGLLVATGLAIPVFNLLFTRHPLVLRVLPFRPAAALAGAISGAIIALLEPATGKRVAG